MISRIEHEMNLNWAEAHPKLFVAAVREFQEKYAIGPEFKVSMRLGRKGFITLTAHHSQSIEAEIMATEPREWWLVKNGSSSWAFNSARDAKTAYPGCAPIHVKEITE